MTHLEQTAFDEGKLARLMDERNNGQRARCPYRTACRVRAWNEGYAFQSTGGQPALTPEQEANRDGCIAEIQEWLRRNPVKK